MYRTNHSLFKGSNQLTSVGYMKLFGCYEIGEKRLNMIFKQEILDLEPISSTKNICTRNIEVTKVKNLKDKSKVSNAQDSYIPHTSRWKLNIVNTRTRTIKNFYLFLQN